MKLLSGKGYFLWKLINCHAGRPQEIAAAAYAAGLGHALVKIADGVWRYNIAVDHPAIVAALQAYDIEVWGWQYIYGGSPSAEAQRAISQIKASGVTGFVVNAEREFKAYGMGNAATAYMQTLCSGVPDLPIALSTYRFPSLHVPFPFTAFLKYCDIAMPQVYWLYSHDPVPQLTRTLAEYRQLTNLPIIPTGAAWKQNGWQSTSADCSAFLQAAQSAGLPAANFWSWDASQSLPTWDAIAAYDWPPEPAPLPPVPEPEPEIPEEEMGEVLDKVNQVLANQALILEKQAFNQGIVLETLGIIVAALDGNAPPPPPPVEPPAEPEPPAPVPPEPAAYLVRVTADPRTNARFAKRWRTNEDTGAEIPIMEIYPGDNSSVSDRIQFGVGTLLPVDPAKLRADGGENYYKLTGKRGRDGETLYIRDGDCIKTW